MLFQPTIVNFCNHFILTLLGERSALDDERRMKIPWEEKRTGCPYIVVG